MYVDAIGGLIQQLLICSSEVEWAGRFPLFIDGVVFEYQRTGGDHLLGAGTAFVGPSNHLEPFWANLAFDRRLECITEAKVLFGVTSKPLEYGSRQSRRVAQHLLAYSDADDPTTLLSWRYLFKCTKAKWKRESRTIAGRLI